MTTKEERVRADIVTKYGSVPKMASETGIPKNTIYHALERGLDNTTSKTRDAILEALYSGQSHEVPDLTYDEMELVDLYRSLTPKAQHAMLVGLREYAS